MPGSVTVVLADDEERRLDEEAEVAVLERAPVALAHQEPDEAGVAVGHLLGFLVEGDAGAVHDGEVGGERAVERDETMVEDRNGVLGYHFGRRGHVGECSRAICRHLRILVSALARRVLSGRREAGGFPASLLGAPPLGRAEHELLPAALRGAIPPLGRAGLARVSLRREDDQTDHALRQARARRNLLRERARTR